jgi:hypothetical protein
VTIRGIHGSIRVNNKSGDVSVSGVDGTLDVSNQSGAVSVSINKLRGRSRVTAIKGTASVNLNPEVCVIGELARTSPVVESGNIAIKSRQFRITSGSFESGFIRGVFDAVKEEPSRKGRSASTSGKIDLLAASTYALHADRFDDGTMAENSTGVAQPPLPELFVSASDKISVASLSWKEAIRQKYNV